MQSAQNQPRSVISEQAVESHAPHAYSSVSVWPDTACDQIKADHYKENAK